MEETIREGTVAQLGTERVGASNFRERTYPLSDGKQGNGMAAILYVLGGATLTVGAGSIVEIGGQTWRVTAVTQPSLGNGEVKLVPSSK